MSSEVPSGTTVALLNTELRRRVVALLLEVDRVWDIQSLARELLRLTPPGAFEAADSEAPTKRVATRLYHCTLPKLADADAVVLDTAAMTVAPGQNLGALGSQLDEMLGVPTTANRESPSAANAD